MHDIDLRKTYCKLDSEHIEQYKRLIRERKLLSISGRYLDDIDLFNDAICINEYSTICRGSAQWCKGNHYTEFTGIKEENNAQHPHHDLIVEWAKDTSKGIEASLVSVKPHAVDITKVINDTDGEYKFQFKPEREFIEGHWYPCITNSNVRRVCRYKGVGVFYFSLYQGNKGGYPLSKMKWVGESLGPISFPKV